MVTADLDYVNLVNECRIAEMQKAGNELTPDRYGSCDAFQEHVRSVEAAVIHTYQITAFRAVREANPLCAAKLWQEMVKFCERALTVTKDLKDKFPGCGTQGLYNTAIDYMMEAQKRYSENLEDSECPKPPDGLFPKSL